MGAPERWATDDCGARHCDSAARERPSDCYVRAGILRTGQSDSVAPAIDGNAAEGPCGISGEGCAALYRAASDWGAREGISGRCFLYGGQSTLRSGGYLLPERETEDKKRSAARSREGSRQEKRNASLPEP